MNNTNLEDIIRRVLALAKASGATSAEASIGASSGLSTTARHGQVETVEHQRDKGLNITLFIDHKKGSASTTDFGDSALQETVTAARTIANHASEDEYAGLIAPEYIAREVPDLDLYHPWNLSPEEAIDMAVACEGRALAFDKKISNSEGATISTYSGSRYYGNSHGFVGGWDWSSHSIDCSVIVGESGNMQRDGWFSRRRDHTELEDITTIAETAARRALMKLDSRKLPTLSVPVIFEAPVADSLFGSFINAISGGSQYRKSTFLLDKAGEKIFPDYINIHEKPHIKKGMGSAPFDSDGMATRDRQLVADGILQGYVLSGYSARKLGLTPTGNAGGVHNLIIEHGRQDLDDLIRSMGKGLLITDLIGFGINQVTGDYSRGASGFWIEHGEIQYPVEEITVAGNLADMYRQIIAIANDIETRGNIQTGSVLIENMTVAGN
ncbi:MAG: metalloprotease PmbA [Gammaproteobacteria bacterium]